MSKASIVEQLRTSCLRVFRGIKPKGFRAFATDVGYYGRGLYYSTDRDIARFYADHDDRNVVERCVSFKNPLVLGVRQARRIAKAAGTIDAQGYPRRDDAALEASQRLTERWRRMGHDAVVVIHAKSQFRKTPPIEVLDLQPPAGLGSTRTRSGRRRSTKKRSPR